MISTETVSASTPAPSFEAELHTGQLEDYELLLSTVRDTPDNFVWPELPLRPSSPLTRVSEDGYKALWQVLRDRDYIDMCTKHQWVQGELYVALKDGKYVYNTWTTTGYRANVELTGHAKWEALIPRIERTANLLGGKLNSNRQISFDGMCWFYGIASWPRDAQKENDAINVLQEKIASHRLKLEEDFEALDLRRNLTEKEVATTFPDTQLDSQQLHTDQVRAEIIEVVNQLVPENGTSPLTYLAKDILSTATTEQVRATPTVYLERILHSAAAAKLGNTLLTAMDWYGGKTGEETSPYIQTKLIANALQYWLSAITNDNPAFIAGYNLQARSNWGKSYAAIRTEFEAHLLTSKRASSEKEAIVIARLFLPRFPTEFRVADIPVDLAYRSSIVWVNFLNGVNIIKASDPGSLDRLTFEQLLNLPMLRATGATPDELKLIGLARLLPTLDWAVTQGIIPQKNNKDYTVEDIDLALSELDKHTTDLNEAMKRINEAPPKRLSIAEAEMKKLFGKDAFLSDGRKLARFDELGSIGFRDTPVLKGKEFKYYSFVDVLASGKFDDQKKWLVTQDDGESISKRWIRIDENRTIKTEGAWPLPKPMPDSIPLVLSPFKKLPDVEALFNNDFNRYLKTITSAYETLIRSLLASLPFSERQALEFGEVRVYSLRKSAPYTLAQEETPASILALRARNGLILQTTHNTETVFHELLPRAGMIRRLDTFDAELLGGRVIPKGTLLDGTDVHMWGEKNLPFDWEAHSNGGVPKNNARCSAIVEQLGPVLSGICDDTVTAQSVPKTLTSCRSAKISNHIATQLLFVAPEDLRSIGYGQTRFELEEAKRKKIFRIAKIFVPFWNSIEDVTSGDRSRIQMGVIGLFFDVLAFGLPMGKFAAGSARLVSVSGRLTLRATQQSLASLTKNLVISTLQALNPIDAVYALLKGLGHILKGIGTTLRLAKQLSNVRYFEYVRSLPQLGDAGRWKPWVAGDQLASVKGVDDVPVRNLSTTGTSDFRLLDPLSSKPYGPSLHASSGELFLGRSHYSTLEKNTHHVTVELAENARVREVLEVDGRTTLFVDDVPYRLKNDRLCRADLIEVDDVFKAIPCRVRRAPGPARCQTNYVLRYPAPTPDIGSYDDSKGWAPWFGDSIYTPATNRTPMLVTSVAAHSTLPATMEFQKGIYGRVLVSIDVPGQEFVDTFRVGATLSEAIDGSKHYIFMRLNAGDFYVAERLKGQSVHDLLTFKKADTLPPDLKSELMTVYTGSLNANNMARIHGVSRVERALQAMEKIAVPIGGHANPPATLKLLKVDTSPGEAVLFDHSTRMIVRHSADGAATWSSSRTAPQSVRETTADVLNTLFRRTVVTLESSVQGGPKALRIDRAMQDLQERISKILRKPLHTPRNIAFAEIKTNKGVREVYVSVSGRQGDTDYLPLFSRDRPTGEVKVGDTSYFNIDHGVPFPETSLSVSHSGKLRAIPHTIDNIETYTPVLTARPTSLDTESKLIGVIRSKYPDPTDLESITIATTMAPCDSCAIVMKQFGYDGGPEALDVIWK